MVQIIYHRSKCIGCNGCVEAAPDRWRVSRKDGKCNLIGSKEKKGIHQIRLMDHELEESLKAAENCPARIIQVKQI